uniref:Olfactory receptor 13 n=1 Tax=Meteorus pulchricornis TaxID=51522 RepID=A0A1S5VFJ9_9HYME|nr:olfactory receptor 13 [Meteorus pulchricornis]
MVIIFIKDLVTKGNCGAITDLVDAWSLIATSILSVMKLILSRINHKSMHLIVNSAIEDWNNVDTAKTRGTMMKYAYIGRLVFIVQMSGAYTTVIPLIFKSPPNFDTGNYHENVNITLPFRNIPIGPNCWLPLSISENIYLLYYLLVTLHLIILCTAYIGGDVYIFGIAMHVCGQFQLLYDSFEKLDGSLNDFVLRNKIHQLIQRHCHLLMLANEFENAFNLVILVQVAANTFIIGISGEMKYFL